MLINGTIWGEIMDEYISKKVIYDKVNFCTMLFAGSPWDSGYNAAMLEMQMFVEHKLPADVLPAEVIDHIKHRMMETAFNSIGDSDGAGEIIEVIANRIDLWVDDFKRGDTNG